MPSENKLLVIGIDDYPGARYNVIANAKLDANRFIKVLTERYGFELVQAPLFDAGASYDNIRDALIDLAGSGYEEDNLVVYYAGHGEQNPHSKKGYWIPFDAEGDAKKYIYNSTVLDDLESVDVRHILLISDSCYSGTFITRMRIPGMTMSNDELDRLKSRWVFVSGEETPVSDGEKGKGSPFGISLCNFLEKNTAIEVSAGVVFDTVIREVGSKGNQQPQAAPIKSESHAGGQMIFRLSGIGPGDGGLSSLIPVISPLPDLKVEFYIPRLLTFYDYKQSRDSVLIEPEISKIYLNSVISSENRIVILGGAGSGKSVELLYQAHSIQTNNSYLIPIFKRFNTYTEENLTDYLPVGWRGVDSSRVVLFLDGLDEIQPKYFQTAIRKITSFSEENPLVKIVISCRNNFYELPYQSFSGTLDGFSVYTLNDITIPQIRDHVSKNFDLDGQDFIEKVYRNAFLDLVQKPFFLNILVRHFKEHGDFNSGRAGMMEEALLKYYENDKQHFLSTIPQYNKSLLFDQLEKIAFISEVMGRNYLTEAELNKILPPVDGLETWKYLPAFNKQGDTDRWMFEHNNLQEYIASRVLAKKNSTEVINLVTIQSAGKSRIRPSWVNTLSFFVSIGDTKIVSEIMDWIIKNDQEVIVKFEPDRISQNQRIRTFKEIFNFYTGKQIWLRSNNFSDKDMARFGESVEVMEFLLSILENPKADRIAKLNSLHVLSNFNFLNFPDYKNPVTSALVSLLNDEKLRTNDIYSVLGALADVGNLNDELLNSIIERYKNRSNQYIRTGMYKLIVNTNTVDKHIDIFLDGLDLSELDQSDDDREKISLFDENLFLKIGLESVRSEKAIIKVLSTFADAVDRWELILTDYKEVLVALMIAAQEVFSGGGNLFQAVLKLYKKESLNNGTHFLSPFLDFFDKTNTRWVAFRTLWEDRSLQDYIRTMSMERLINTDLIEQFSDYQSGREDSTAQIKEFYDFLFWYKRSDIEGLNLIKSFEQQAFNQFGIKLEMPELKDWREIHKRRDQQSFDLWFDNDKMFSEVMKVFKGIDKETINRNDVFNYNYDFGKNLEDKLLSSVHLVISLFTHKGRVTNLKEIKDFVLKNSILLDTDYWNFAIGHIHSDINNKRELVINQEQLDFIVEWCKTIGNNRKILWDFVNRFSIQLPEEKVLDLTKHTNFNYDVKLTEPASIEQLEKFVSKAKIKPKVIDNIKDNELNMIAWTSNAGYALRHNFTEVYPDILKKLELRFEYEYKFDEILTIWFSKTKNVFKLKELVRKFLETHLRWKAVRLLDEIGTEIEFLNTLFHEILASQHEPLEEKIYAANWLMKQDDIHGFYFLADLILSKPDPNFEFRHNLGSISMLKNVDAVPGLMKMLELAKQPDFRYDRFNDLEERVLSALYNIGIQSNENYKVIKSAIEGFMEQFFDTLPNVNFLYFTISKIEDQLKLSYLNSYSIDEALEDYNSLIK